MKNCRSSLTWTFQINNPKFHWSWTHTLESRQVGYTIGYTNFYRNRTISEFPLPSFYPDPTRKIDDLEHGGYRGTVDYMLERVARGSDRGWLATKIIGKLSPLTSRFMSNRKSRNISGPIWPKRPVLVT